MMKSRNIVFIFAIIGLNIVLYSYFKNENNKFKANEQFANKLVNSIINDTHFYKNEISEKEDLDEIIVKRSFLDGEPEKVLADNSWGGYEFGYCLNNDAYLYTWFSDRNNQANNVQIEIFEPGSSRASICNDS